MVRHFDAIVSQGTLRPLEPLALPEGTRVHLSVEAYENAGVVAGASPSAYAKIHTPKLVNAQEAADFAMEVRENPDARV